MFWSHFPHISSLWSCCVCNNNSKKPTDIILGNRKYTERDQLDFRQRTMANLFTLTQTQSIRDSISMRQRSAVRCRMDPCVNPFHTRTSQLNVMILRTTFQRTPNLSSPSFHLHRNLAMLEKALSFHKRTSRLQRICDALFVSHTNHFFRLIRSQATPTTINKNYYTETWVTPLKQD